MNQVTTVETESPLRKFDEDRLKAITSTQADDGVGRALFQPANMAEAMEVAKLMAAGNFVPGHLRGKPGDCLAVVMQSARWGMDPFAVGNKTYFVNDRMAFEAQLVTAVINSANVLDGRLQVKWEGEGNTLVCTVTGKVKGDPEPHTRRVPIASITTRNSPLWKQDPQQQLGYFAQRAWVRLFAPEVLLGVYTPDELRDAEPMATRLAGETAELTGDMLIAQSKPQSLQEELGDEIPNFERKQQDDETDAGPEGGGEGESEGDAADEEQDTTDPRAERLATTREQIEAAKNVRGLQAVDTEWQKHSAAYDDDVAVEVNDTIRVKMAKLREAEAKASK